MDKLTIGGAVAEAVDAILKRLSTDAVMCMEGLGGAVGGGAQRAVLRHVLQLTDNNQSKTARILGVNRTTLRTRMRREGLLPTNGRYA